MRLDQLPDSRVLTRVSDVPGDAVDAGALGLRVGRAPTGRRSGYGLADVIGTDDRREIWDAYLPPWRYICSLVMIYGDRVMGVGTAWFAGPRLVLTAGHCLQHANIGERFDAVDVVPARSGAKEPFGRVRVQKENFRLHPDWEGNYTKERDAGAILLSEPVAGIGGWFNVVHLEADDLNGWLVNVAGYPAEVNVPTPRVVGGEQLWVHSNAVEDVSDASLSYAIDTSGGQSGGPVFIYGDDSRTPVAIGIHAYGIPTTIGGIVNERNSATRIDGDLMGLLKAWQAEVVD